MTWLSVRKSSEPAYRGRLVDMAPVQFASGKLGYAGQRSTQPVEPPPFVPEVPPLQANRQTASAALTQAFLIDAPLCKASSPPRDSTARGPLMHFPSLEPTSSL